MLLHTLGLNADAKIGPLAVSGVAGMQLGHRKNSRIVGTTGNTNFHGYLLNAAAKLAVGPGTAKVGGLYASGDEGGDNHNNGWQGTAAQSYNETGLMILARNNAQGGTTTTSEFVRRTLTNLILANAGFDAKIGPKAYLNTNVGIAWAAKNNGFGKVTIPGTTTTNASNYLGTEIALEGGYKVYDNLTASLQAAYLFTGSYYNNIAADSVAGNLKDSEDPYLARVILTYAF
jgi:hypothetical protein